MLYRVGVGRRDVRQGGVDFKVESFINAPSKSSSRVGEDHKVIETEVLVLGAGSAGIAAGKKLDEHGVPFIILEGTGRIGGRVLEAKFQGKTVEYGANWLHDIDHNPLWKYARKYRLRGKIDIYDDIIFKLTGGADSTVEAGELMDNYESAHNRLLEVYRTHCSTSCELNMREALSLAGWSTPRTRLEQAVELFMFEWMEVLPSENISFYGYMQTHLEALNHVDEDQDDGDDTRDFMVTDQRGYAHLLRSIAYEYLRADDSRLRFNQIVTSIDYRLTNSRKVLVTTEGGQVYAADHVIVTFSNNVITYGDIQFLPALPDWKVTALRHMPTATYTKHFIDLNAPAIERNAYVVMVHGGDDQDRRKNVAWQNLAIFPQFSDTNVVLVTNLADEGVNSSLLTPAETIDFALRSVADVYPSLATLDRTGMAETHHCWVGDRFARGSYATPTVGLDAKMADDLKASVNGVIHFAGDGSNLQQYGTVHSAFINGQQVATQVVSALRTAHVSTSVLFARSHNSSESDELRSLDR